MIIIVIISIFLTEKHNENFLLFIIMNFEKVDEKDEIK